MSIILDHCIDGRRLNGPLTAYEAARVGFSGAGCPWRGTTTCYECPYEPATLCDYWCVFRRRECEHRAYCKCGHDQTHRLKAWGVVE